MKEHPPIPPNCLFTGFAYPRDATINFSESAVIKLANGGIALKSFSYDSGIPWRKVWADVCRCAWMDEAKRQHQSIDSGIGPAACYDNAEAWRIWGLKNGQ